MAFQASLTQGKSRNLFLVFFFLAAIFPVLIAALITHYYILPNLSPAQYEDLSDVFVLGLGAVAIFPLLSFFLMYRWIDSLEGVTAEIVSKSAEVASGQREFREQSIQNRSMYAASSKESPHQPEENEIQSLIRSFNAIFESAANQLEERNRLKELLAKLIGVASDLTSELDFDRLFPLIVGNVTEVMAAERTSLYVVDWEHREIWTTVAEGIKQIRLPFGQGISGRVAETGEMINVADAWELPYYDRSFDEKNNFRTKSVLCIPIRNHLGEIIGVLQVINKKGKERFDQEDEIFLRGLSTQVSIALENSLLVEEVLTSFTSSISTLSTMVDARHPYTAGHSERVKEYSLAIAREMKLSKEDIEPLKYAAILHDIGKIGIRDDVLMKNGSYTPEDWEEMKAHPLKTKIILDQFHFPRHLRRVPEIAYLHHEKMNGEGYPNRFAGDRIPLEARIIAVADMFDAVTSKREYPKYTPDETLGHDPMPLPVVMDLLKKLAGQDYDPFVIESFIRCLPEVLILYRGNHFAPEYVDDTIRQLGSRVHHGKSPRGNLPNPS
jgi:HD-GYP domain-containing protein (c-di-GMP phosphodiesterase class II)